MSLTLISNPQKQIIICIDIDSFFVSDVSELDFRWTLPNQQSKTENITVTNVGTTQGTLLSISLPTGFFTTQTFPQIVGVGDSIIIPIYFLAVSSADYSANTLINGDINVVTVSLLGGVQSKGLQFDGVNDYVISTQDVSWERTQAWTFFFKYKNVNWFTDFANGIFIFARADVSSQYFTITASTGTNALTVFFFNAVGNQFNIDYSRNTLPSNGTIQITYNGTPNLAASIQMYVDNVLYNTGKTEGQITLTGTLIGTNQKAQIGRFGQMTAGSVIQEISLVNYVKSAGERTTDYNAGYQSKGSGDYLFRQSFNVGGTPINLKADVLAGVEIDTTIIGQTIGDFVNF
jgi:hypothetical protein